MKKSSQNKGFQSIASLFKNYQPQDKGGFITREFQDFGYRLAIELKDMNHKSLYIKMARDVHRPLLERALSFVKDANAKNKAKLFMWKVKQLKLKNQESKIKNPK